MVLCIPCCESAVFPIVYLKLSWHFQARKEQEALAAEGGWTVVVHHKGRKKTTDAESGIAVGSVAQAAVLEKEAKKKSKTKDIGVDFYRFQKREAQRNGMLNLTNIVVFISFFITITVHTLTVRFRRIIKMICSLLFHWFPLKSLYCLIHLYTKQCTMQYKSLAEGLGNNSETLAFTLVFAPILIYRPHIFICYIQFSFLIPIGNPLHFSPN